jgi:hypothetical protein
MIRMGLRRRQKWGLTGVGRGVACMVRCRFIASKRSEECFSSCSPIWSLDNYISVNRNSLLVTSLVARNT